MDTRIGYPGEHLAGDSNKNTSPMFSTAVGLLMNALDDINYSKDEENSKGDFDENQPLSAENNSEIKIDKSISKKSIFDKWVEKFKDFLDNA